MRVEPLADRGWLLVGAGPEVVAARHPGWPAWGTPSAAAVFADWIGSSVDLPPMPAMPGSVTIEVAYGGLDGPDLPEVAGSLGLSAECVVALHSQAVYRVAFLGFRPGFAYLTGLPERLRLPRRSTPRPRIAAGSVAIADEMTGIYPSEGPGGWHVIGRAAGSVALFDPLRWPPSLLRPGQEVRFAAAVGTAPDEASARVAKGTGPDPADATPAVVEMLDGGPLSTVQDLGRPWTLGEGVSLGGAADPFALRLANRLAGNEEGAAGLEILLRARLRFMRETRFALAGADLSATLDGQPCAPGRAHTARAGAELRLGRGGTGLRAYLALAGGIAAPLVLGSRSTDVGAGFGGASGNGAPLRAGDRLTVLRSCERDADPRDGAGAAGDERLDPTALSRRPSGPWLVPFVPLSVDWDADEFRRVVRSLEETEFRVRPESNRVGLRLAGPPIPGGGQIASRPLVPGAIQLPADGAPIIAMPDCGTTGGYRTPGVVISAALPVLSQLAPGHALRLVAVSLAEARRRRRAIEAFLANAGERGGAA